MALPIDDETMTYDYDEHRYILTPAYVLDKTGVDLSLVLNPAFSVQPQRVAEYFLDKISSEIYSYVYSCNADNSIQMFYLATNEFLRTIIRRAMLFQIDYVLRGGFVSDYNGVNVKTGQIMDRKLMGQASISPDAERELNKIIPNVGVAITYQGQWTRPLAYINYTGEY